ncbi:hypothetical protein SMSP2_01283 [Limihaloglobus sulfuriphilus]|uniref:Type IV secretory pathway, VirD4 component n=1 Tax=Limihaloglobus sulfuriphilus TaxID=1851148 RepID=A0A1Q2ME25_9BACT|nr:hypothetical protein [Limihaloglobus sulfuriphilus]AQQ70920.1 hypothetical protein SMSP2_01283 [Limihaloglobus sulfuriphilus]
MKLYELFRIYDGTQNQYPTLFDLFESVKADKDLNHQARIAIVDNLEPILRSLEPDVLGYRYGWRSTDLAGYHIAFELAGCSEVDKNLILNTLILSEFISRVARGISNPKMDLLIYIDEAQKLCCNSSAIADLIGLVRGTGIGVDLSLQSTSSLLPQVISNTSTKIMGRCGSFTDYSSAGSSMGLSSEMIHWAQHNLNPGTFIGQLGEGQWRHPFVFSIPKMNLNRNTGVDTDRANPFPELKVIPAKEFADWPSSPKIALTSRRVTIPRVFESKQEYLFCKAVVDTPMKPSSEYPKIAGISPNKARDVRKKLIDMKYIKENVLETGGRGRSTILLEALPEGIQAIEKYGEQS